MATREGGVQRESRPTVEMTDLMDLVDNLGAVLIVTFVLQFSAAVVGLVTGGLVGPLVGFGLTVGVSAVPLGAIGWLYLSDPHRTERLARAAGRLLVVIYALWGVTMLGAYAFGAYLYGVPLVLTPPVRTPPILVAAFYLIPLVGGFAVTRYVVALKT